MQRAVVVLAVFAAIACATRVPIGNGVVSAVDPDRVRFDKFVTDYSKVYATPVEREHRFTIFKDNLRIIASLQPQHPHGKLGVNQFADVSPAEFRRTHLMRKGALRQQLEKLSMPPFNASTVAPFPPSQLPPSFNWAGNATSPVKNQGQCGSCWAHSAVEQTESMLFLADRNRYPSGPPVLSVQQIVDCDHIAGVMGCDGGWSQSAFEYITRYGLESDSEYPYVAVNQQCRYDASKVVAHNVTGYQYVTAMTSRNETQMQYYVAKVGPISICVDAAPWQYYIAGVLSWFCPGSVDDLDHCVQLTGYGVGGIFSSTPYWTVRNSWGTSWGYAGYIYVERGDNTCGVGDVATTAIVS